MTPGRRLLDGGTPRGGLLRRLALWLLAVLLATSLSGCFSAPPQVVALEPNNGSANVAADAQIRVRFDRPVETASLRPRFHIEPDIRGCDLAAAWSAAAGAPCRVRVADGGAVLEVDHAATPFLADTKYTLRLDGGFRDTSGVPNSLDHRWELTTGAPPRVTSISPSDGAGNVAADSPLVIAFNSYMRPASVTAAVRLEPPVPGTRVFRNTRDHTRFVVLPGRLLTPGQSYTLRVSSNAVEEHGLALRAAAAARFTVSGIGHDGHALVLAAGATADSADRVLLTSLGPRTPGDPIAAASVYEAPRCQLAACGSVAFGQPTVGIAEAAISPDSQRLALVVDDLQGSAAPELVVQPTGGGSSRLLATGSSRISWSSDSTRLAYALDGQVHVVNAGSGADLSLPPGRPLRAPVLWEPDASGLVLPVTSTDAGGTSGGIDLADAALGIRYPLPVLTGRLTDPALSPNGSQLAVRRDGDPATAGTWVIGLAGSSSSPSRLAADLTPLAWAGEGTLVAKLSGGSGAAVRLNLASGDRTAIPGLGPPELASLVASSSGRQVAYLRVDAAGVSQAYVENSDGSNPVPLTTLGAGDRAVSVSLAG